MQQAGFRTFGTRTPMATMEAQTLLPHVDELVMEYLLFRGFTKVCARVPFVFPDPDSLRGARRASRRSQPSASETARGASTWTRSFHSCCRLFNRALRLVPSHVSALPPRTDTLADGADEAGIRLSRCSRRGSSSARASSTTSTRPTPR